MSINTLFSKYPLISDERRKFLLSSLVVPTSMLSMKSQISLQDFSEISKQLLELYQLDATMVRQLYKIFSDEPWGMTNLEKLRDKLLMNDMERGIKALNKDDRWFLDHFLTTWITGIYYHQRGNQLVSYEHALMYTSLHDIRPTPGLSSENFGFWQDAPKASYYG